MKINKGSFIDKTYIKQVSFNKAVLWKCRELSLPTNVINVAKENQTCTFIFEDRGKNERWLFDANKVFSSMKLKQVGQEPQYYFPIELAKKEKINETTSI